MQGEGGVTLSRVLLYKMLLYQGLTVYVQDLWYIPPLGRALGPESRLLITQTGILAIYWPLCDWPMGTCGVEIC